MYGTWREALEAVQFQPLEIHLVDTPFLAATLEQRVPIALDRLARKHVFKTIVSLASPRPEKW